MNDKEKRQQPDQNSLDDQQAELSAAWQELLGRRTPGAPKPDSADHERKDKKEDIPTLESDPWSTLIQAKGVEIVDLHKARLQISDQEVEQMLEVMQEQSTQKDDKGSSG